MLQEMKLEDALKKFLQGKKVLVAPARAMDPGKERYLFRSDGNAGKTAPPRNYSGRTRGSAYGDQ